MIFNAGKLVVRPTSRPMTERVDFSRNAPIYDRRHGRMLPSDIVRSLASASALNHGDLVLEVGAGTGRAALAYQKRPS